MGKKNKLPGTNHHLEKAIENNILLKDVAVDENSMWSFLLMGGYLKQTSMRREDVMEKTYYTLSIPNKEVRSIPGQK